MKRRDFLKNAAGAAGLSLARPALSGTGDDEKPNIIVILADDLGYGDISPYDGWIETPHLERMAREGLRFTDFHANCPVCSPTRASLVTGRYQQRTGIDGVVFASADKLVHYHGLQTSETTFAEVLKRQGYATGLFGKWHLGYQKKYNPLHHGFDRFAGYVSGNVDYISHRDHTGRHDWWHGLERVKEDGYVTRLINDYSVDFIEQHRDEPFCLYMSHEAVHRPYQKPGDPPMRGPNGQKRTWDAKEAYRVMMEEMDRGIGRVLKTLRRLDLDRRTLVFFFSDNGARQPGSNAPFRGHKGSLWEGGHRVPAIAWWPGRIPAGAVTDATAAGMDLMPTMLSITGADHADIEMDGVDLSPVLFRDESLPDRPLFWQFRNQRAMRDGKWKLVRGMSDLDGAGLYDLSEDPAEQDNLAGSHPDRVKRMTAAIGSWMEEMEATATPQPQEIPKD